MGSALVAAARWDRADGLAAACPCRCCRCRCCRCRCCRPRARRGRRPAARPAPARASGPGPLCPAVSQHANYPRSCPSARRTRGPTLGLLARPRGRAPMTTRETPVLLLHGLWHGTWCWSGVLARLTAAGRRALAVDMAGQWLRARRLAAATARPFDPGALAAHLPRRARPGRGRRPVGCAGRRWAAESR